MQNVKKITKKELRKKNKKLKEQLEEKKDEIIRLKNELRCKRNIEKDKQDQTDDYRVMEKQLETTIARLKIAEKENTKLRKELGEKKEQLLKENEKETLPSKEPDKNNDVASNKNEGKGKKQGGRCHANR